MAKYKKRSDGRYQANVNMGYDAYGKLIRKTVYAKSIRELEEKIFKLKQETLSGIKSSDMTLYDYSVSWFKTYKAMKSINTRAMYDNIIEKHIKDSIGYIPIGAVTKSDIQNIITERSDKRETCNKILLTLRQIFNSAIDDDLIFKNPAKNIELPPVVKSAKRTLTTQEKKAIVNADFTPMQKAFIFILFYCGLRREEALALTPSDFDFKNQTVTINKAIVFDKNTPVLSAPKNISSNRTVPLPSEAIPVLKDYISHCKTIQLFTMKNGSVMSLSSYVRFWDSIVLALNFALFTDKQIETYKTLPKQLKKEFCPIKGLTAHIFRHNYATMLYYSGISIKKAAALMGHTDTKMIMQVYAHLDDEKERAAEKINECIKIG